MKELIAMCDTPEIQDKWEPKVGDKYLFHYHTDKRKRDVRVVHSIGLFEVQNGRNGQKRQLYIPSIEDVLEWLGDRFEELRKFGYISSDDIGMYAYCVLTDDGNEIAGHEPIEALLKAYMHLEGFTWNAANLKWEDE